MEPKSNLENLLAACVQWEQSSLVRGSPMLQACQLTVAASTATTRVLLGAWTQSSVAVLLAVGNVMELLAQLYLQPVLAAGAVADRMTLPPI